MNISKNLLLALPKTDLHVHLDGSLRLETLIDLAKARGVELPSYTTTGLEELVFKDNYENLGDYLHGFMYTCGVMQDPEALERVSYELAWDNINEGVRYIEVRFAPQLHMRTGFNFDAVMLAVDRGLARAQKEYDASDAVKINEEPPFRYGIIVCAMRKFAGNFSPWYSNLCNSMAEAPPTKLYATAALEAARAAVRVRDETGIPIVGFDLAGEERGYPADDYVEAYQYAKDNFLKCTVHAGEAYGPESIYQAITGLHADRIGHGYHLFDADQVRSPKISDPEKYVQALARYISDSRITIEVCITSNLQTNPNIGSVENHVFRKMIDERLSATLCTDNRLISKTSMTKELAIAVDAFNMTEANIRNTVIYGFKRSFFPGSYIEKRAYVRKIIDFYEKVWLEHTT